MLAAPVDKKKQTLFELYTNRLKSYYVPQAVRLLKSCFIV